MAYQRSRVLCAAARLGVADALKEGERSVQEIAGSCAANAATLHRLLRTLAAMGVVAQARQDTFVLTELGEKLRKDATNSAWPAIIFWADLLADNWSSLTECVRTARACVAIESSQYLMIWSLSSNARLSNGKSFPLPGEEAIRASKSRNQFGPQAAAKRQPRPLNR
jgi:predicted transcriptional regulator